MYMYILRAMKKFGASTLAPPPSPLPLLPTPPLPQDRCIRVECVDYFVHCNTCRNNAHSATVHNTATVDIL